MFVQMQLVLLEQHLLLQQQRDFNNRALGSTLEVLLDKPGKRHGQYSGKSEHMHTVIVDNAEAFFGKVVPVKITEILTNTIKGEIVI